MHPIFSFVHCTLHSKFRRAELPPHWRLPLWHTVTHVLAILAAVDFTIKSGSGSTSLSGKIRFQMSSSRAVRLKRAGHTTRPMQSFATSLRSSSPRRRRQTHWWISSSHKMGSATACGTARSTVSTSFAPPCLGGPVSRTTASRCKLQTAHALRSLAQSCAGHNLFSPA